MKNKPLKSKSVQQPAAPAVSSKVWHELYCAALEFYMLKPCGILEEEDIFSVYDPYSKQMGYVCITGSLGEMIGMVLYRGDHGYKILRQTFEREFDENNSYVMDCITVSLVPYDELDKDDKKAMSSFCNPAKKQMNPQFRSFIPSYFQWYLTEDEAKYMTIVLHAACIVIKAVKEDDIDLHPAKNKCQAFYMQSEKDSEINFTSQVMDFPSMAPVSYNSVILNENRVLSLSSKLVPEGVWESDIVYFNSAVMDRERPYYTRLALIMDADSGFAFNPKILLPERNNIPQEIADLIINNVESNSVLPEKIRVSSKPIADALMPLAKLLDIEIVYAEKMPRLNEFIKEAKKHAFNTK